ncbi:hypothetical protein KR222_000296 [Zaprionus bogoriensis]|nr:hypothetical protein KR222_000296 [Zaprionus bogoriensis]
MRPHARKSKAGKQAQSKESDISDEETAFQSPDRDDQTDYGLEFTTSRLSAMNTSPRRCSTLRKNPPTARQEAEELDDYTDEEYTENRPPASSKTSRHHSQKQATRKAPAPGASSRRKQAKPEHCLQKLHQEIVRLQLTTKFLIPRLPFSRVVREVILSNSTTVKMITPSALEAIQTAAEMYLTQRFQDAYLLTNFRNRVTLEVRDMAMVAYFCKVYGCL